MGSPIRYGFQVLPDVRSARRIHPAELRNFRIRSTRRATCGPGTHAETCRYADSATPGYAFTYTTSTGQINEDDGGAGAADDAALVVASDAVADPAADAVADPDEPAPVDACGLLGIEPLIVLAWVRRRRSRVA
jgi:hypothetical protein